MNPSIIQSSNPAINEPIRHGVRERDRERQRQKGKGKGKGKGNGKGTGKGERERGRGRGKGMGKGKGQGQGKRNTGTLPAEAQSRKQEIQGGALAIFLKVKAKVIFIIPVLCLQKRSPENQKYRAERSPFFFLVFGVETSICTLPKCRPRFGVFMVTFRYQISLHPRGGVSSERDLW